MKKIIVFFFTVFVLLMATGCEEKQNPKKEYKIEYSENLTVEVGQNFNPRDYFTILDGETAIDKADVNLAIISGSTNTKGEIKYKITYDGTSFELVLTVVDKKTDQPIVDEKDPLLISLENALKKDYTKVTFQMDQAFTGTITSGDGTEVESDFEIHETNYIEGDTYHIVYEDTENKNMEFYVDKQSEYVFLYRKSGSTWSNTPLTYQQWEAKDYNNEYVYADYFEKFVTPQSFSLQTSEFEVKDGKLECIPTRVDLVGQKIFNLSDDNAVFTSVILKLEGDTLKEIVGTYDSADDYGNFSCVIKYSYSGLGTTTVDLPDVAPDYVKVPEHIDPNLAAPLNDLQKQTLNKALSTPYTNYEFEYNYNEKDGYSVIHEKDSVNGYSYLIHQTVSGYQNNTFNYYFDIEDLNNNRKYYIYEVDENKRYVKTELTTQQEIINYMPLAVSPSKLSLSVTSFGMVGDKYVCTPTGLKTETKNFTNLQSANLISLVLTLDKEGKVERIDLITKVDAASGTYYIEESYIYSKIDEAVVEIPLDQASVLTTMTTEQQNTLNQAFKNSYSNVTIYDEYSGSTFYFADEKVKTTVYQDYTLITDYYKIENGKYFELKDGTFVEIPFHSDNKEEVSFNYYLPVLDFSKVNLTKVSYDTFHNSFYISVKDLSIKEFAFYYDIEEMLGVTFTGIEFVLNESGKIERINFESKDTEGTYYVGLGLVYSNYGLTIVE